MKDNGMMEIVVSRVINAQKWRILRMIAKIEDFPKYMPNVKEVRVLERRKNRMKTKWRIQVDEVPISWVEEEVFDFSGFKISFRATEGDLQQFEGQWLLQDHPEGTQVTVNLRLKIIIPAIQHFAQDYVKNLITRNFDSMLKSIETRLISIRYAGFKRGDIKNVAGFGVLGHLYNFNHLARALKNLNPNFKMPSREFLGKLFELTPSFKLYDIKNFRSKTGQTVDGCFIVCTFIPDMVQMDVKSVFSKVVRACKVAEKYGVGIVTLGGFSSIVGERFGKEISKEVDVPITTGNTFTASLAMDGVLKAAKLLDMDLKEAEAAVIGGTGDIGSACSRVLAEKVKRLVITGRTPSNLRRLKRELRRKRNAAIEATTNNQKAVKNADIIIAAASVSSSILDINWFKPGSIICDLAYPKNVSYMTTEREDILIFSGGLAKIPSRLSSRIDVGLPSDNITYGCFSEAIILALECRYEPFSYGRGNITLEKMDQIKKIGLRHGFEVAPFYWGDRLVDENLIGKIKRRRAGSAGS